MSLRTRLWLSSILIAIPLAVLLFFVDERMRLRAMEENLRQLIGLELATGGAARCEADPARFGSAPPGRGGPPPFARPGPPPFDPAGRPPPPPGGGRRGGPPEGRGGGRGALELFAYAADGAPARPDAPPLPPNDSGSYWTGGGRGVAIRVATGDAGACATWLARMPPREGQLRDQLVAIALLIVSVIAGVVFAAGPLVARLQRLALGVRASAASHYAQAVTVEGRDEVALLASAFNDAGAEIKQHLVAVEAREQTLRQFVANTTHDVAVPLTVLQGHLADIDAQLAPHAADDAARKRVRAAIQEAHYMGSLLRNLDIATKLGDVGVPLDRRPVDLSELVDRVVARHRPIARASGVELNAAVPPTALVVHTDLTLLEQALGNLVDNAIRYNLQGGHVAVVLDGSSAGFTVSVADDGPGVSDAELAQLTARWFRGSEARTRRPDGKGLGLAIVTEVVARLGLQLTFRRSPEGGLVAQIAQPSPH